jgi:hypothetical protein
MVQKWLILGNTDTAKPTPPAGRGRPPRAGRAVHPLKDVFRRFRSRLVDRVIDLINPLVNGWVNYFRVGHSSRCFGYVKDWVEKKIRRHLMRARQLGGFGW